MLRFCILFLLIIPSFLVEAASSSQQNHHHHHRRPTAVLRAASVNMSHALYIPPDLGIDEVVESSNTRAKQEAAAKLRSWAENILRCMDDIPDYPLTAAERVACSGGGGAGAGDDNHHHVFKKCDSSVVHAWNIMGVILQPSEKFKLRPSSAAGPSSSSSEKNSKKTEQSSFTKRGCFFEAIKCDPAYPRAWYNLGQLLVPGKESIQVGGKDYTNRECFLAAVSRGGGGDWHSDAWYNLGLMLINAGETVAVVAAEEGKKRYYDRRGCFVKALSIDPNNAYAWNNLANALGFTETVQIPISSSSSSEAGGDDRDAVVVSVGRQDCYIRALELLPEFAIAWYNLGSMLGLDATVSVAGRAYTKKDCFVEAFNHGGEAMRVSAHVWNNVGNALHPSMDNKNKNGENNNSNDKSTVVVDGVTYTKRTCYEKAVSIDESLSSAWNNLGSILPNDEGYGERKEGSTTVTSKKIECFVKAIKYNGKFATPWANLGDLLLPGQSVEINRKKFSKKACLVRALRLEERDSYTWNSLGALMLTADSGSEGGAGARARIGKKQYTPRDCFAQAARFNPENSEAWYNLGVVLNFTEVVDVGGETFHALDCFVKSLTLTNGGHCQSWTALGNTLDEASPVDRRSSTTILLGKMYGRKDCYIQAILCEHRHHHDHDDRRRHEKQVEGKPSSSSSLLPNRKILSTAWHNLGVTLHDLKKDHRQSPSKERPARVGDLGMFTRKQCFVAALEADDTNVDAWYNLGALMQQEETASINGVFYGKQACFEKYDELRPHDNDEKPDIDL